MSASDDPAAQLSSEATGASDDLEHWLSDLRTDVATDPSDWLDDDPAGGQPTGQPEGRDPLLHRQGPTSASEPSSSGGRHRAPD